MNHIRNLQQGEKLYSTLTGLFEGFNGMQTIYFGDLYLTNKRLYVVSHQFMKMETSLWFKEQESGIDHSTFMVGEDELTIKWLYRGNLRDFMRQFQNRIQ
ncbi:MULTISPECIES: hypothetical protein [Gracilibacillus]|uniref:hypothetical protein n=1 Tax=Gracilibacillus TaxID=74385 RepID=UPI0008270BAC|nr:MULTISPECIES: hypothetical protein [Gracilibacillus]